MKKDASYQDMQGEVFEDSECPTHNPPPQNAYEEAKWNSKGFNQSGFKGK